MKMLYVIFMSIKVRKMLKFRMEVKVRIVDFRFSNVKIPDKC